MFLSLSFPRNMVKMMRRTLRSLYWYLLLRQRNAGIAIGVVIRNRFGESDNVHIVCPGPSVRDLEKAKLPISSLVIFVNHAVALQASPSLYGLPKIAFSSDPVRAAELIENRAQDLHSCTSVLMPGHLFHLSKPVYDHYNYIYTPSATFSRQYGFVGKGVSDATLVLPPISTFTGYGFGSLPAAIILSLLFNPKKLHFWGCDLRPIDGEDYGISDVPRLAQTPYQKIRDDVTCLHRNFISRGIEFIFH